MGSFPNHDFGLICYDLGTLVDFPPVVIVILAKISGKIVDFSSFRETVVF